MARILKLLVGAAILAGVVFGGYTWLQGRASAADGFQTVQVARGSITEKAVAVGKIEPRVRFHVKSKISGIVRRCLSRSATGCGPGDALFEIVPDPTPAELVEAQRAVELGAVGVQPRRGRLGPRVQELVRQGVIPQGATSTPSASRSSATDRAGPAPRTTSS